MTFHQLLRGSAWRRLGHFCLSTLVVKRSGQQRFRRTIRHPGHLLTHGSLQLLQPQLLSAPPACISAASLPACPGGGREGGIRLCSYLRETTSPSLLIKFPQPLRLVGAGRQTTLQAGGENVGRAPSRPPAQRRGAHPRDPRRHPSCRCPSPQRACSCPAQRLRAGCGQAGAGCLAFPEPWRICEDNQERRAVSVPRPPSGASATC